MLKKIALLVVLFALPLGAMAQKFAHMNSQEVIVVMPEYTKHKLIWKLCQRSILKKWNALNQNSTRKCKNSNSKLTLCREI